MSAGILTKFPWWLNENFFDFLIVFWKSSLVPCNINIIDSLEQVDNSRFTESDAT